MWFSGLATCAVAIAGVAAAPVSEGKFDKRSEFVEDGVKWKRFEHAATGARLDYVSNSKICETTPGVNQYSGYLSIGTNMNMWFWFFEARNSPTTAPIATWFNGGPGCSSMIGLFQENGPCHFTSSSSTTPTNNTYSWNNYANMLYVDQPIGVGFSYGTDDVSSTTGAANEVWTFLQAFYSAFPQYKSRDFGLFTESYGGHYGPAFAKKIQDSNTAIDSGSLSGTKINLIALGINNGWFDPLIQYKAYIDYSYTNPYYQIISKSEYNSYISTYNSKCAPAVQKCYSSGTNSACSSAQSVCGNYIENALIDEADFDVYDIRQPSNDPNPPETYTTYLASSSVKTAIGAKTTYQECPNAPYNKFSQTGDDSRSFLSSLSSIVSSGTVQVTIWAGDADWICNVQGVQAAVEALTWSGASTFKSLPLSDYKVNGKKAGSFKTLGKLSFASIAAAGHEVPYYQPAAAFQVFKQTMVKQALSST